MLCRCSRHAASRGGVGKAHLKSFVCHAAVDVVVTGSACAGIEPGASRTRYLLTSRMLLHGCGTATVTPSGDKKTPFPAGSAVLSSGCARLGRVKRSSSRSRKWKRAAGERAQRRAGVASAVGCGGLECVFAYFLECRPRPLGPNGHGAAPQARRHLNLRDNPSGSPPLSLGPKCNGCNRHPTPVSHSCRSFWERD